jgi:hypothetical protein
VTNVTDKKEVIETLEAQSTVLYAAKAAGILVGPRIAGDRKIQSSTLAGMKRWRMRLTLLIYQKAVNGDTICLIFYLKAHRPIYRDRLNIDIEQVRGEIEERMAQFRGNPDLLLKRSVLQISE